MLQLRELQVLRCMLLLRETGRLWENWLVDKITFPSPQCDLPCTRLVGTVKGWGSESPGGIPGLLDAT